MRIQAGTHTVTQAHVRQHGNHCDTEMALPIQAMLRSRHLEDRIDALNLGEMTSKKFPQKCQPGLRFRAMARRTRLRSLGEILWLHEIGSLVEA